MDSDATEEKGDRLPEEAIYSPSSHRLEALPDHREEEGTQQVPVMPSHKQSSKVYLDEVGPWGRRFALALLGLATLGCGAFFLIFLMTIIQIGNVAKGLPLLTFLAVFTILSAWLFVRILRGGRTNQVTTFPPWVIQIFGVVFAVGIMAMIWFAIWKSEPFLILLALLSPLVAVPMIRIRRLIRKQLESEGSLSLERRVNSQDPPESV